MTIAKPQISVIVPTHNRSDALALTLSHLAEQQVGEAWEVIVINNRSTDDTDEVVKRQSFPVPLRLVHEDTPGPAAARNAGAAVAGGDYLVFIDNDILVEPDFVELHRKALAAHPGCWILGQTINLPEQERTPFGRFRKALYPFVSPKEEVSEARGFAGANCSLPRLDLERLGGFDERFNIASVEDFELAMRAWEQGISILFDPGIVGVHNDWAGSSIRDYCYRQRMYARSEFLLWYKYGEQHPRPEMVRKNMPPVWKQDGPWLFFHKWAKRCLGSSPGQRALLGMCVLLERVWPWPPLLWRMYRWSLAGAIYTGFQEGLAIHGGNKVMKASYSHAD